MATHVTATIHVSSATGRAYLKAAAKTAKPSKYRAVKTVVGGIRFASKREARRYNELLVLARTGHIKQLRLQPAFELSAGGTVLGHYLADFEYLAPVKDAPVNLWVKVYEDAKGFRTPLFRWKKKHVEAQYGITIREV